MSCKDNQLVVECTKVKVKFTFDTFLEDKCVHQVFLDVYKYVSPTEARGISISSPMNSVVLQIVVFQLSMVKVTLVSNVISNHKYNNNLNKTSYRSPPTQ